MAHSAAQQSQCGLHLSSGASAPPHARPPNHPRPPCDQALELYKRALEYFSTHLKYDKNPKSKEMIQNKVGGSGRQAVQAWAAGCSCERPCAGGMPGCAVVSWELHMQVAGRQAGAGGVIGLHFQEKMAFQEQ